MNIIELIFFSSPAENNLQQSYLEESENNSNVSYTESKFFG